ncbi:hypothetical protein [Streptomyces halobius]|uniref:SH3 domain-containing protein n=1 Tax=Streptomyces halobius TaxID=2879846 RepID=A0ABY4M579_9ACTN|nr:hypothetical protein [Streptomyces halobius]UQA91391.1 hypothetical protein K9S39_05400 [Streptomyces halobius]
MRTLLHKTAAAAATGTLLLGGGIATATSANASDAAPTAKADSFNQKVTCTKGAVRSKPYGKGSVRGHVYQGSGDWGHITASALFKSGEMKGTIAYWYGTWHHGKKSAKGWVYLSCADPREES